MKTSHAPKLRDDNIYDFQLTSMPQPYKVEFGQILNE